MTQQVARLVYRERLPEAVLCRTARDVVAGVLRAGEADLGDALFKKRIARPGGGKRGGFRVIAGHNRTRPERVLFAYVFAKNVASTLTPQGYEAFARVTAAFLGATDQQVAALVKAGDMTEIQCNGDT